MLSPNWRSKGTATADHSFFQEYHHPRVTCMLFCACFDTSYWLQKFRVIIRISNNCKQRERHVAQGPTFQESEKLLGNLRQPKDTIKQSQLTINLSSLTIVPMPAILIVLHMIISGSPTQSAAYRSHHSQRGTSLLARVLSKYR